MSSRMMVSGCCWRTLKKSTCHEDGPTLKSGRGHQLSQGSRRFGYYYQYQPFQTEQEKPMPMRPEIKSLNSSKISKRGVHEDRS